MRRVTYNRLSRCWELVELRYSVSLGWTVARCQLTGE